MLTFSPCLEIFFNDLPFAKRIHKVAELGYTHFEFWTWWDKNPDEIAEASASSGTICQAFCTRFISLVDRSVRNAYLEGLAETIEIAQKLNARIIISQVGNSLPDISREQQKETLVEGLQKAAVMLKNTGLVLAIEPLNVLVDHPGYFLTRSEEALEILQAVTSENIKMLFDVYHQQISEGNLIPNLQRCAPQIAHVHIADHPGRHEIGTGEINYTNVLKELERLAYQGTVGIELFPITSDHRKVLSDPVFFSFRQK